MTYDMPARLLRLLSLLQTRREWSGSELADRLDVTVRTVRRDVERLRGMGYPVDSGPGQHGGYRLTAGTDLPPLLLDDDEAVALAVALRTTAPGLTHGAETALRALAKIEQVLPSRLRGQVSAIQATVSTLYDTDNTPRADPAVLAVLAAGCRDHEILTFDYADSPRRVEPHALVAAAQRWYLIAYDTDRADWRLYRVDRLHAPRPTGHRVAPRRLPADSPAAFAATKITDAPTRYHAVARVAAPADTVGARTWGALPDRITPVDAHNCTVDLSGDALPRIAALLVGLDADYTLDAEVAVVEHLTAVGDRIRRSRQSLPDQAAT